MLSRIIEVLKVSTRLGFTSFGGPAAHLGYFREEYVKRRKWLDEDFYAEIVALAQFLPGPASSQVGIAIGTMRAGILGGIASWIGFTLPSALALLAFAFSVTTIDLADSGLLRGLLIVAVAVVAHAVWGMAKSLTPDPTRASIAIITAVITLVLPTAFTQVLLIILAGLFGWLFLPKGDATQLKAIQIPISRSSAILSWFIFFTILLGLPLLRQFYDNNSLALFDSFFRVGSLVFGGGHVVLPLLQTEIVGQGWLTETQFIAGYGAAQAVPGPLFTFAAYLGGVIKGVSGSFLALVAMFLPSFLLVFGALPFWGKIRNNIGFQAAVKGVNASVVGILLAALYNPVWTKAIKTPLDFSLALMAFALLVIWKLPPWLVVLVSALGGVLIPLTQ